MSGYVWAGVALAGLLIGGHIVLCIRAGAKPSLEKSIVLVLSAIGVGTGVKVVKICLTAKTLKPFADENRVYIALGGYLPHLGVGVHHLAERPTVISPG